MPYKSDKQRRYFHAAQTRGEIPKSVVEEYNEKTRGKTLPEAIKTKKYRDRIKKNKGG